MDHEEESPFGDDPGALVFRLNGGAASTVCNLDDPDDASWQHGGEFPDGPVCQSFAGGHHVHPIQAKRLSTPSQPYELIEVQGQLATFFGPDGEWVRWWFHNTTTLAALLLLEGPSTVHLHRSDLLRAGRSLLYPCRSEEYWRPCRFLGETDTELDLSGRPEGIGPIDPSEQLRQGE